MPRRGRAMLIALLLAGGLGAGTAWAGRPLDTEDTGTVEPGRLELQLGGELTTGPDHRAWELRGVLGVGVVTGLEVRVEVPLLLIDPDQGGSHGGLGDGLLGIKYRVLDEGEARPAVLTALVLRLPTGSERRGLGAPGEDVQLLLVASKAFGPVTLTANAGYTLVTDDRDQDAWTLAASVEYELTKAWTLVGEIVRTLVTHQAADQAVARVGMVHALSERVRLDAAVGLGLTRESPDLSVRLGVTLGF